MYRGGTDEMRASEDRSQGEAADEVGAAKVAGAWYIPCHGEDA